MGSRKHMPLGEHEESHACLLPRMRSATAAAIDPSPIISEKSSQCKYGHACYSYTCMLEVHVHQGMCMNARVHVRMSVNMYVFSRCVCVCTLGYSVRKEEHSPHIHVRKRCIRYLRCHMYTACSLCVVRLQTCMHGLALWCFTWPRLPDPYRAPATPPAKLTPRAGVP